ncbi:DUF998 domain-containing protein [Kitasatospora sp. NPDC048540]|uniref:DUF998 domain-containing protein n=1 Tax=Kitasatospora sp. NPDC048540 TaxID=3155634 RepID=UPI0033E3116E
MLLTAGAVVYNDWPLEFFLPTGLDPANSYASELYAADQPFHVLFGAVELVAAALVASGALTALAAWRGALGRAGWGALAGFAAFSVADVMVPMRCAASVEPGCEVVNPWHTLTSALVHFALFASMALLILAARRDPARLPGVARRGPVVLTAAMATAVATVGPLFGYPGWHGVTQRAHLVLVGVWFVLLATGLSAVPAPRVPARRRPELPAPSLRK